jgi:hypothetical protein
MHDVEGQTIDDVRAERDALGIQLAAQGERLRLAMAVVDAARALDVLDPLVPLSEEKMDLFADALAALDAVPGDALAPTLKVKAGPGFTVERAIHATWVMNADERTMADWLVQGRYALPPSPAGVSGQPSGSTPAASSVTYSDLEVEGSRCGPSGTRDVAKGWDAVNGRWVEIPPHLRALEASGIDTDNVKGGG